MLMGTFTGDSWAMVTGFSGSQRQKIESRKRIICPPAALYDRSGRAVPGNATEHPFVRGPRSCRAAMGIGVELNFAGMRTAPGCVSTAVNSRRIGSLHALELKQSGAPGL